LDVGREEKWVQIVDGNQRI